MGDPRAWINTGPRAIKPDIRALKIKKPILINDTSFALLSSMVFTLLSRIIFVLFFDLLNLVKLVNFDIINLDVKQ